ncbi:MAG: FHA domain-containing protein, partial [Pseudomonadota bacterium]
MMMQGDSGAFSQSGDGNGLLRVLSGAQAGAEIALKPRTYIIGSGEDCDVYLAEPSLAGAHLALTIDDTVSIAARDGAVAIEGRLIQPGESVEVTLPLIVDLGAATLGLGDRETNWRVLTVPDLVALQAAAAAAEAERTARETETTNEEGEGAETSEAGTEAAGDTTAAEPVDTTPIRSSVHPRLRLLLGIACIVMAGVVAFAKQDRLADLIATTASSSDLAAATGEDI